DLVVAGEAVGGLAIRDRRLLEEAVDERAVGDVARGLLEVAAQAEVAVGQREDRLVAGGQGRVERQLPDPPRVDRIERPVLDHRARAPRIPPSRTRPRCHGRSTAGAAGTRAAGPPWSRTRPRPGTATRRRAS